MNNYLLALKLGEQPDSKSAHQAIRHWLQQRLDEADDPERYRVSQWLQAEIVHTLVDKKLFGLYTRWLMKR